MQSYLSNMALFKGLPADELDRLGEACEVRSFKKGETVFEEGKPADFVWVVRRGWVYLTKRTPQGGLATIFTMTPDEALCGVSAFDRGLYFASAVAAADSQLIKIPARVFGALLDTYPKFSKNILLACCARMRQMAGAISLAAAPVEQRIAYMLLRLHGTFGSTIPVTHQQLARMVGARLETSIRTVAHLKQRGFLASARGRISLLRLDALNDLLAQPSNGHAHGAAQ